MVTKSRTSSQRTVAVVADGEDTEERFTILPGSPHPLGARPTRNGVNFSVFSEHATAVTLLLFDEHDDPEPIATIELDPKVNKSFHFWHVFVKGAEPGLHYAY